MWINPNRKLIESDEKKKKKKVLKINWTNVLAENKKL